jgi:hypothetical protein
VAPFDKLRMIGGKLRMIGGKLRMIGYLPSRSRLWRRTGMPAAALIAAEERKKEEGSGRTAVPSSEGPVFLCRARLAAKLGFRRVDELVVFERD